MTTPQKRYSLTDKGREAQKRANANLKAVREAQGIKKHEIHCTDCNWLLIQAFIARL